MKSSLRWFLHQLFLFTFQPTRFKHEREPYRANRPLGFIIRALIVIGSIAVGYSLKPWGVPFDWESMCFGLYGSIFFLWAYFLIGWGLGFALSAPFSKARREGFAKSFGALFCILLGIASGVVSGIVGGVAGAVFCGLAVALAFGTRGTKNLRTILIVYVISIVGIFYLIVLGWFGGLLGFIDMKTGLALTLTFSLTYFRLVTYPIDLALAAMAYLNGRLRGFDAGRAWKTCPVTWNEVIWLPLPFVSTLLVMLVQQDRKRGLEQITFIATERTLQRRVAIAALEEVAINDLKAQTLASLVGVAARMNWTTDAPAQLPEELAMTLPRFERASQHVGQYFMLNSPFRKVEALARAVIEIEALQRSLIVARGHAPRLLKLANEWRGLLEQESIKAKALAAALSEIANPFIFGLAVAETERNVFTGRRDIVDEIEHSILGGLQTPTLLLHGPRRMGKTSILNQLPRLLGPDFAPTVLDCQNPAVTTSVATLLHFLSRNLSEALRRRRVVLQPLAVVDLGLEPFVAFDKWLDSVEQAMPVGMRALVCLDEYERLQVTLDAGWGTSFLDALRHTLQHRPRVVLMFTGAHTFRELGPAWTDRFISSRRVRVSFLSREEVEPLLRRPIPEFDMTYAPGALDAIMAATGGQPFLTQATAFELVRVLNEQQRKEATREDVEMAIERALDTGGEYFENVWSDAGAEGQAILRAIARDATPPDIPDAHTWLCENDVLNAKGDFAVEMVRRWVKTKCH